MEDSDNIRYNFNVDYLKTISKYLYGFFGPGLKPIEKFNQGVLYCANLKLLEYICYNDLDVYYILYTCAK